MAGAADIISTWFVADAANGAGDDEADAPQMPQTDWSEVANWQRQGSQRPKREMTPVASNGGEDADMILEPFDYSALA